MKSIGGSIAAFALVASCVTGTSAGASAQQLTRQALVSVFVEPDAGYGPVVSLLGSAKKSVDLEVYELTEPAIFSALDSAKARGVVVKVLLEKHPLYGTRYALRAFSELQGDGISVKWANETAFRYTHEKAVVVDGTVSGIFTLNLSESAFTSNREFGVIDRSKTDSAEVSKVFRADWKRRQPQLGKLGDLVISPVNSRSVIGGLISGAKKSLDLYEEEIEDAGMESKLESAAERGVKVRLITSDDSAGVEALRSDGVNVVLMSSPYVHAKAIVADDSRVFIGSENISTTSLDSNRELGIILDDKKAVATVERSFASDWEANGGNSSSGGKGKLSLKVSANPGSVTRGELLTITAHTSAGAACTIVVTYPDGYVSQASELQGSRTANAAGAVSWAWHVGSTVTGKAKAAVNCSLGTKSASKTVYFEITK